MVKYTALRDEYEVEKTIGTGGFAKVKLARHLLTGEKVAIKIMNKETLGDDLPRVKMEITALRSLSHHHICKLYQVIETDTHFFLIMEYCAGGELFDHIVQCNRLSEMTSRSFFRQILSAVAYLHSQGYVHRDIKPENILLDKDQCVKLIDFGLCTRPVPSIDCQLHTACGSPNYAAPELIRGDIYMGKAVDVWSMGVMLYALLCGCLPFDSEKIDVLYKQILSGEYMTPEYLSKDSRRLLGEMLQTDPGLRISVERLLCHPWVTLGYNEPVSYTSLYEIVEQNNNCLNTMAAYYAVNAEELWSQLKACKYDSLAATYQLLLLRKKQGLLLELGRFKLNPVRGRLNSMRRAVGRTADGKGTYTKLPSRRRPDEKENDTNKMQPPDATPKKSVRKRPLSPTREPSASPALKIAKRDTSSNINGQCATPKQTKPNQSRQTTPTTSSASPSAKLLSSIERKIRKGIKVFTPSRRSSSSPCQPALLTAKNMCNISTTSSNSPDQIREELVKALENRGIECKVKGYCIRGKLQEGKSTSSQLSFELEICLIPTAANAKGSVVGIRRKRLKGDSMNYKRVCEEILNLADVK